MPHGEFNTGLIGGEFESLLTDSLDPVGPRELICLVHFVHFDKNIIDHIALNSGRRYFVIFLKLRVEVRIDDAIHSFQIGRGIAQVQLQLVLDGEPLRVLRVDLLVLLQVVLLQVQHSSLTILY